MHRLLQEAVVREAAVEALLGLYAEQDNLAPLHEFTERFKGRYCELPNDISDAVAVQGVSFTGPSCKQRASKLW